MSTPHIGQTLEVNGKQYECTRMELDHVDGELHVVYTREYDGLNPLENPLDGVEMTKYGTALREALEDEATRGGTL